MNMYRHRPKRRRKTKSEKEALYKAGPFANICDQSSLIEFLRNHPNLYNDKVLTFMERQDLPKTDWESYDEKHHIIPTSAGGPDKDWNLIPVSYNEHKELHKLRYEIYKEEGDRVAAMGREEIHEHTKQQKTEASKRGHATQKAQQIGRWSSELQAELGRRSALAGKTPARELAYEKQATQSDRYVDLFHRPLKFIFKDQQTELSVQTSANQFRRTGQIREFLLENTPQKSPFYDLIQSDRHFTSNFNKVLRKLLPNPKGQEIRPSYKGWTVTEVDNSMK